MSLRRLGCALGAALFLAAPAGAESGGAAPAGAEGAAAALRIALIGTSLSARYDWPGRAGARLAACLGRPVEMRVHARPGATSDWGRDQADWLRRSAPDLLILEFTINDADLRRGVSVARSRANHAALIAALRSVRPGAPVVLLSLNGAYGLRRGLRPFLGRYLALYDAMAAEDGAWRVDLGPGWQALVARDGVGAVLPDGLHPSAAAADAVNVPGLAAALADRLGGSC